MKMQKNNDKFMQRFWIKLINIFLILCILFCFNKVLETREQAKEIDRLKNELEYAKQNITEVTTEAENSKYTDGEYEGSAKGFGGDIFVKVIISAGKISDITVVSAEKEDKAYYDQAVKVIDEMKEKQSAEVDTVSGATFSSTGIINAVSQALEKAEQK